MLYSKNGSIPKPETDNTDGWIEVPDAPIALEGQEIVWCFPPGWIVRETMPAIRDGYFWAYYLDKGWVEIAIDQTIENLNSIDTPEIL